VSCVGPVANALARTNLSTGLSAEAVFLEERSMAQRMTPDGSEVPKTSQNQS
jgi:hypothetical protein